jgi:hypothetical protein
MGDVGPAQPRANDYPDQDECSNCHRTGWVCETHPKRPFKMFSKRADACECGGAGCRAKSATRAARCRRSSRRYSMIRGHGTKSVAILARDSACRHAHAGYWPHGRHSCREARCFALSQASRSLPAASPEPRSRLREGRKRSPRRATSTGRGGFVPGLSAAIFTCRAACP